MLKLINTEIQIVIKSHTYFAIPFFKYASGREKIFFLPHKYPTSMGIHLRSAWNSHLQVEFHL